MRDAQVAAPKMRSSGCKRKAARMPSCKSKLQNAKLQLQSCECKLPDTELQNTKMQNAMVTAPKMWNAKMRTAKLTSLKLLYALRCLYTSTEECWSGDDHRSRTLSP